MELNEEAIRHSKEYLEGFEQKIIESLENLHVLSKQKKHDIEVTIDRTTGRQKKPLVASYNDIAEITTELNKILCLFSSKKLIEKKLKENGSI